MLIVLLVFGRPDPLHREERPGPGRHDGLFLLVMAALQLGLALPSPS
ncbi:hypothetical protein AB0I68_33075 [Streptomyces sp. NPDC050448]